MDKANIIISIIIVVCIAAAVAAYGITNSDNPIFSDLSSMSGSDNTGNGLGNSTANTNHSGSSVATTSGGSSSGSGGSSSGGSGTGSGGSGSSSNGGSNSGSNSGSSSSDGQMSYATAHSIANSGISEPGCYAAGGHYTNGMWIFTIYDANGNNVGSISVYANGQTGLD